LNTGPRTQEPKKGPRRHTQERGRMCKGVVMERNQCRSARRATRPKAYPTVDAFYARTRVKAFPRTRVKGTVFHSQTRGLSGSKGYFP
jgi:hypothetical protein